MSRTLSLAAARALFAGRGPFTPDESQMLRAAALSRDFAPTVNAIDSRIEAYLFTVFGPTWRDADAAPDAAPVHLTRAEAARWTTAAAARQDAQRVCEVALDALLAARRAINAWDEQFPGGVEAFHVSDRPAASRSYGERSKAEARAEKEFREAKDRLTAAHRVVRAIEAQAGERRYWDSVGNAA